jgi:ABC-type nitrate/sulfonate/bicarbonate transport system substrate-binding protein
MPRLLALIGAAALSTAPFAAVAVRAQEVPTIRVGWTIPAEEGKYTMMRRPAEFTSLGKTYRIEWSQFQGTSAISQALAAGAIDCGTQGVLPIAQGTAAGTLAVDIVAQHVGEKPGSFSVYWAVKEDSPIKTVADMKGKTVGISIINGGTQGPFNLMLRKAGLDPERDIKLVEVTFPLAEDALRSGRVDVVNMNQPFAARAEAKGGVRKLFSLSEALPNIVHIVEACRKDFIAQKPDLARQYVKDVTLGMKKALANREETMKVVSEVMKVPAPVLDTYLLKDNDFARRPDASPDFPAIQAMLDVYADTGPCLEKADRDRFPQRQGGRADRVSDNPVRLSGPAMAGPLVSPASTTDGWGPGSASGLREGSSAASRLMTWSSAWRGHAPSGSASRRDKPAWFRPRHNGPTGACRRSEAGTGRPTSRLHRVRRRDGPDGRDGRNRTYRGRGRRHDHGPRHDRIAQSGGRPPFHNGRNRGPIARTRGSRR